MSRPGGSLPTHEDAGSPVTEDGTEERLKWLEYTALGLPVVAADVEPYATIEDGVTGRRVLGDPAAWADAIEGVGPEHAR